MAARTDYEPNTGQLYRHWDMPALKPMRGPWNRVRGFRKYLRYPFVKPDTLRRGSLSLGAAPLVDMCLRVAVKHSEELDRTHLRDLPILFSDTFDFLTHLTITGTVQGNTSELLKLVQLKNLAILEILQPKEEFGPGKRLQLTDSIVREWSKTPDPFPVLRVLRVWANDSTTTHSLRYVCAFPSLVLYDVAGRARDWEEKREDSVWDSKAWTWRKALDYTVRDHFHLLHKDVVDERWKLKIDPTRNPPALGLLGAFQVLGTKLTTFLRGDHGAYRGIFKLGESFLVTGPPLYLGNPAMVADEALWAFLAYCYIGQLLSDRDLLAQGLKLSKYALALSALILPARPMLNLNLRDAAYDNTERLKQVVLRGRLSSCFEVQYTFIRKNYDRERRHESRPTTAAAESPKRPSSPSTAINRPLKKRSDLSYILNSFNIG
ncbi:hypothetical protein NUW58_g9175 [Xylaria curta]|uniref:Uncharacterized protein n=1 Tax=Xylaria curta TaxID=42375 RepID=A0ACC1N066_9PEZI|nr:hypothetical protein NUW58_g9175 [Xylaria curta]